MLIVKYDGEMSMRLNKYCEINISDCDQINKYLLINISEYVNLKLRRALLITQMQVLT